MHTAKFKTYSAVFTAVLSGIVLGFPHSLKAQQNPPGVDIVPAATYASSPAPASVDPNNPTHPLLRLTPDKSEIVRLDREAATVIVGNPNHLSILADNTKTLVLVPKAPGATYFTVLDNKANVVMQRHVIVASPGDQYIRIRKTCASTKGNNCQDTQVYYCPDMCHEIMLNTEASKNSGSQQTAVQASSSSGDSGGTVQDMGEPAAEPGPNADTNIEGQ